MTASHQKLIFLLCCSAPLTALSFATTTKPAIAAQITRRAFHHSPKKPTLNLVGPNGDHEEGGGTQKEPTFFQMQTIPTATAGSRLDRVVDCANNGQCDVDEMFAMIEELECLNSKCQVSTSRECSLDAVVALNVLKVALASRVVLEEGLAIDHVYDDNDVNKDDNPYSSLRELDDLSNDNMHTIPTAAIKESNLERFILCAEDGECPEQEMAEMFDELERLNDECSGTVSRECSLDAMEARNILKVAIGAQLRLARETKSKKS